MTLDQAKKGQDIEIISIPDEIVRAQTLRFGISEGSKVECYTRVPRGPVILKKNLQEIAVGYDLAKRIEVKLVNEGVDY
ncbi:MULTISPECIES: FeoA family protein [unclassified Candidatus Frackibacter]|uniref:FeoA family protein n=1 Tax=unclassified Candidatus Frackibacter TaxID=2648818 RepID=UPI00079AC839|nr:MULTISPECIES: ferrous iron transport protein A [unclassified Candidatus Frackibacter]KXS45980.1 MAG: Fe2+ transport system protein A [Candidatus Frackibacter sp. T328-2]SDC03853.1 Fe2+ transport system protein FeoA [Candidatus Frackibacter sp. WG11]SEM68596.1 Fe2+ transport system protein FeoA [Candidatus Frackibacter sp. WG12]SFL79876.1 Fe2+ transport system protein FeoA [Candidatus Frackibacter sp. WG13]